MSEPIWRRYLRLIRPDAAADVDDEVRFHLENRIRDYRARGLDPAAAARAARERFGDVHAIGRWLVAHDRRRHRMDRRREGRRMILRHLRYAVRGLLKQPGFTIASVVTLALGIGATSGIFAVVDGVLLSPLPYAEPDRLVTIKHAVPLNPAELPISQALYTLYRRFDRSLAGIGVHFQTAVNLTDGTVPERVAADSATASVFSILGITPLAGRSFTEADEQPGHPHVALISEALWRRRYDRSPAAIGRLIRIDDVPHEIVGVLPAEGSFPAPETAVWLPLGMNRDNPIPIAFNYAGIARLKAGTTAALAERNLQSLLPRLTELFANAVPGFPMSDWVARVGLSVRLHPLQAEIVGDIGRVLWIIFGTIGFLLLAACANIASLFLARAESRQRELAVYAALGASRRDLVVRLMMEGLLLAATGAVLGTGLAAAGLSWIRSSGAITIPRIAEVTIAGRALLVTTLVTVVVALFTALFPIVKLGGRNLAGALRSGGRASSAGRDRRRVQRSLVVTQVALAYVLLMACALLARSFVELRRVRLGFEPDPVLAFRLALPPAGYPTGASAIRFYQRLGERLESLPGVRAVGFTSTLPLEPGRRNTSTVEAEGDLQPPEQRTTARSTMTVSDRYFESIGVPILSGRPFTPAASDTASLEAIVSAAFARTVWHDPTGRSAVGRRLRFLPTAPWTTVVGVAGDTRDESIDQAPAPVIYLPLNSAAFRGVGSMIPRSAAVTVRAAGDPTGLEPLIQREVAALDPGLPLYDLRPLAELVRRSMARTSMTALLLAVAALVALLLGTVGLYGIVSYTVGTQRREIGLRMALGAPPAAVVRTFARSGALLAAAGIGIGVIGALLVTRTLRALLFGIGPMDPASMVAVAAVLLAVAIAAAWVPARRAGAVDPATVLTGE